MPEKCELCGNSFEDKEQLNLHMGLSHEEEAREKLGIVCEECGKKFESGKVLQTHRSEIHDGGKVSNVSFGMTEYVRDWKQDIRSRTGRELLKGYWKSMFFLVFLIGLVVFQSPLLDIQGETSPESPGPDQNPQTGAKTNTNQSSDGQGMNSIDMSDLPEKTELNSCQEHEDCASTCCGAYNQENRERCDESCTRDELKVAACIQGRCVSTDQDLPSSPDG